MGLENKLDQSERHSECSLVVSIPVWNQLLLWYLQISHNSLLVHVF
jgi:hypothetical protein